MRNVLVFGVILVAQYLVPFTSLATQQPYTGRGVCCRVRPASLVSGRKWPPYDTSPFSRGGPANYIVNYIAAWLKFRMRHIRIGEVHPWVCNPKMRTSKLVRNAGSPATLVSNILIFLPAVLQKSSAEKQEYSQPAQNDILFLRVYIQHGVE